MPKGIFLPISDRIKKRGAPIGDRSPEGFFHVFSPGIDLRSMPGENRCFSDFFEIGENPFFSQGHRSEIGARRVFFTRFFHTFFSPSHFMAREKNLSHFMAREKNLSHIWLGKKILPIYGSEKTASPYMGRKKNIHVEETLVFYFPVKIACGALISEIGARRIFGGPADKNPQKRKKVLTGFA